MVALEGVPTRRLTGALRRELGLPKERVHSLAYWKRS
ncbi:MULTISPECIES: siderophore-interacting protein [Brachybacterium]|nr:MULTISPECIES: siderophore-interacting protein [Brachybacterium]